MHEREGFINFTISNDRTNKWCIGIQQSRDKDKLRELVELIDKHDSLGEIKNEVFNHLGISKSLALTQSVAKVGMFSLVYASPENNALTELQASLLKGFVGFRN